MKYRIPSFIFFIVIVLYSSLAAQLSSFITAQGDKLMDGTRELRFISFNIPALQLIEDNELFTDPNPWRLANEFEIRDALTAIKQVGANVTRIYVPSIRKAIDNPLVVRHVESPGQFNEEAFKIYDKVLQIANEVGVRIIFPFVDNWWWWGGVSDYARFRNKPREAFWTDSTIISDFKKTIEFIVNRRNTITGVLYKEDKAVLGWEIGNELEVLDFNWTINIAAYIKSLDKNHLVIEGTHSQVILDEAVADPNIDVLSTHYYRPANQIIKFMLDAREKAKGKKPYFVGEFGAVSIDSMRMVLDSVISSGISGIMIWSMLQHNRDGGFYYHNNVYRWPGFDSGKLWKEKDIINLFREKAFQISGTVLTLPPVPIQPKLLPIETPYKISWQGSTGASSYIIERKDKFLLFFSCWSVIDSNASDANVGYRPLFSDTTAEPGVSYSYRIRARNCSGISEISEPMGPVQAPYRLFIDEFENERKMKEKSPGVKFLPGRDGTRAKEDRSRLEGTSNDYLLYQLSKQMTTIQLDAFFTTINRENNLSFSSGIAPDKMVPLSATRELFEVFKNNYRAYCPVRYSIKNIPFDHRYIKIQLEADIQLGRLEIGYDSE